MARNLTATRDGGRATFLLEVALDRALVKQRLAAALLAERERRGGGDARRFPQPQMALLLGYSLRQYQRLEDGNDQSLPSWSDLDRIADTLGLDAGELFGEVSREDGPPAPASGGIDHAPLLERLLQEILEIREGQDAIAQRLERLEARPTRPRRRRAAG